MLYLYFDVYFYLPLVQADIKYCVGLCMNGNGVKSEKAR